MSVEGWSVCLGPPLILAVVGSIVARGSQKGVRAVSRAGVVVTWAWPLLVSFAGAGHCPQGDPETWSISHILCAGVFVIALPLLAVTPSVRSWRWTVPVAVLGPLLYRAPELIEIAGGRHLCGSERGEPTYTEFWETAYVPAMVTYAVILSLVALVPYTRSQRVGAPPAEPA